MRSSSASQSIQLVNVLEVDIIYGTAVNNMHDSTIVAVHKMIVFTCNLSLLIFCQLPKVLFGGIYKNREQKYICVQYEGKKNTLVQS